MYNLCCNQADQLSLALFFHFNQFPVNNFHYLFTIQSLESLWKEVGKLSTFHDPHFIYIWIEVCLVSVNKDNDNKTTTTTTVIIPPPKGFSRTSLVTSSSSLRPSFLCFFDFSALFCRLNCCCCCYGLICVNGKSWQSAHCRRGKVGKTRRQIKLLSQNSVKLPSNCYGFFKRFGCEGREGGSENRRWNIQTHRAPPSLSHQRIRDNGQRMRMAVISNPS